MNKFFTLLVTTVLLISSYVAAEQATLIDFSQLKGEGEHNIHGPTIVDYSKQAGSAYTEADKSAMKISLAVPSWEIKLASSARTVENQTKSYVMMAQVKNDAAQFAGESVMGIRIHFPDWEVSSYATIAPPFVIPAYATIEGNTQTKPGSQFDGFGILKNVGAIKSIQMRVLGRNYPYEMFIVLENEMGEEHHISMGHLLFEGWKSLIWTNPRYNQEVRNRELKVMPLYPRSQPFIKLKGMIVRRDSNQVGGDFVGYVKDIKVIYDKATNDDRKEEVDDEAVWGILKKREEEKRNFELARLGNLQVLRALEKKKMALENEKFSPDGDDNKGTAAAAAVTPTAVPATNPQQPKP